MLFRSTVVDGLLPGDYLKHAPVRTYFRIISGAMFLLKTFALGASKSDVELSIGLMDSAVSALRNCVVDDVHLGIRFADLLETLTSRLRSRFISAPTGPPPPGENQSRARSPIMHQESDAKRQKVDHNRDIRDWQASTPNFGLSNGPGKPSFPHTLKSQLITRRQRLSNTLRSQPRQRQQLLYSRHTIFPSTRLHLRRRRDRQYVRRE